MPVMRLMSDAVVAAPTVQCWYMLAQQAFASLVLFSAKLGRAYIVLLD